MEPQKVASIEKFNKVLENIEYQILRLAKEYEKEIKVENPDDYELEVIFEFCADEEEKASWFEDMKFCLERIREGSHDWGLASGEDHNAALESALHGQKHCWLLHLLYDDLGLKWNEILKINWLWLDFVLYYQYDYDISRIENLSQMKSRLLEIQKELLSRARSIRQKARRRVLKGEMTLFDYELSLRILFYDKEGREGIEIIEDIKFEDPFKIWEGIRGFDKNRIFSSLEYQFEELGFELEKMLTFKELWANLVLKYSHRFCVK